MATSHITALFIGGPRDGESMQLPRGLPIDGQVKSIKYVVLQ